MESFQYNQNMNYNPNQNTNYNPNQNMNYNPNQFINTQQNQNMNYNSNQFTNTQQNQYSNQNMNYNPNQFTNTQQNQYNNQYSNQYNNQYSNQYSNQNQTQMFVQQEDIEEIDPIDYIRFKGLDIDSQRINLPQNPFKIKLKPHQEALVYRALEVDEKFSGSDLPFGVFSDKPGSGKTFAVLALIYLSKKFFSPNSTSVNVIVVPHNIYTQWVEAIESFLGKILTYKCLLEYNEITSLFSNTELLYKYDIIITTPLNYGVFASTVNSIGGSVRRVFFDEADTMKNLLVDAIKAKMTWFISASIKKVFDINTLKAQIGIYKLYLPKLLQNECYCKKSFIDMIIKLPKPKIDIFKCRDFYLDNILINLLNTEQIAPLNAHDFSEIRADCDGANIKSYKDICRNMYVYSKKVVNEQDELLKDIDKKLKFPNREEYNKVVDNKIKCEERKNKYLNLFTQLKIFAEKLNICIECWECMISDDNSIEYYRTECQDKICPSCYDKINDKFKCIGCKNPHPKDKLELESCVVNSSIKKEYMKSKIGKFIILDKIMEVIGHKVIIYSKYRGLNNYLKTLSYEKNIQFTELNGGNIKQIDNVLKEFRYNPDMRVLLIDNAYFGVGVNLEFTSDIIFIHNVDKETENQITGRAQRFGRVNELNIWKLKYSNEN